MDSTLRIWDLERGRNIFVLKGHEGEVINLHHNYNGDQLLSCSFDSTARIWDLRSGQCTRVLEGHRAEINCAKF